MGKFEKGKRPTQAQSYAEPQRAPKKKKQKKQSRLGLIVALLAAAVVLVGCGVGYMFLRDDGRIVNNLYVAGVDLSGMTKEEARAALEKGVSVYGKENMNVALYTRPYDTFTSTYDPAQIPLVDIFGKPLDASAQTEATEPTETKIQEEELALFSPPTPKARLTFNSLHIADSGMLSLVRSPPLAKTKLQSAYFSRARRMPSLAELSSSLNARTSITPFRFSQITRRVL